MNGRLAIIAAACLITIGGCDLMQSAPPPPNAQLEIENVAKWYSLFRAEHRGKAPKSEEEFIEFVSKELSQRASGDEFDADVFLTSPRDNLKYVVNYGKKVTKDQEKNVAVYEQEGYKGKKLIAFESAWSKEVEEDELQDLLESAEE